MKKYFAILLVIVLFCTMTTPALAGPDKTNDFEPT